MNARYRVLHFCPDPFSGARWPFAAIVEQNGELRVARAGRLPGPDCLGGERSANLLRWMHDHLGLVAGFDRAPPAFGTSALLDTIMTLPASVGDPVKWLEDNVLPKAGAPGGQNRARTETPISAGLRFFENGQVRPWVKTNFQPGRHWPGGPPSGSGMLARVHHFTSGAGELLLMEPVLPGRIRRAHDLTDLVTKMQAYRGVIDRAEQQARVRTVVYLLAESDTAHRAFICEHLADVAHRVVDTNLGQDRAALLDDIRRIGQRGADELALNSREHGLH